MITPFDERSPLPILDLYDSNLMLKAIQLAKEDYDLARQDYKDFLKEYGDFMSPFSKDMDRYNAMIDGVKDKINQLYANGIDPLRSAEGRAYLRLIIDSVNPAEYNNMKANAKIGYAYQDALGKLMAAGKFDPDMQNYYLNYLGLPRFEDFSSANGAKWTQSSPVQSATLQDITEEGYKNRTPHELDQEIAKRYVGSSFNPHKTYVGWVNEDSLDLAKGIIPGLVGDWRSNFYREMAAQKLGLDTKSNDPAVQNRIDEQYAKDIADANKRWLVNPTGDYDKLYLQEYNSYLQDKNDANRQRRAYEYKKQEAVDKANIDRLNGWTYRRELAYAQKEKSIDLKKLPKTYKGYKRLWIDLQDRLAGDDALGGKVLLANSENEQPVTVGNNIKGYITSFGGYSDNLHLTESIIEGFAGANIKIKPSKAVDSFNDWLRVKGILGYIVDNNVTALYNKGSYAYEVSGKILVKKDVIDLYFTEKNMSDENKNKLLDIIGATRRNNALDRVPSNKSLGWKNAEYIEIPVTRILDSYGRKANVIDATVANVTKRGSKITNKYEQREEE